MRTSILVSAALLVASASAAPLGAPPGTRLARTEASAETEQGNHAEAAPAETPAALRAARLERAFGMQRRDGSRPAAEDAREDHSDTASSASSASADSNGNLVMHERAETTAAEAAAALQAARPGRVPGKRQDAGVDIYLDVDLAGDVLENRQSEDVVDVLSDVDDVVIAADVDMLKERQSEDGLDYGLDVNVDASVDLVEERQSGDGVGILLDADVLSNVDDVDPY